MKRWNSGSRHLIPLEELECSFPLRCFSSFPFHFNQSFTFSATAALLVFQVPFSPTLGPANPQPNGFISSQFIPSEIHHPIHPTSQLPLAWNACSSSLHLFLTTIHTTFSDEFMSPYILSTQSLHRTCHLHLVIWYLILCCLVIHKHYFELYRVTVFINQKH